MLSISNEQEHHRGHKRSSKTSLDSNLLRWQITVAFPYIIVKALGAFYEISHLIHPSTRQCNNATVNMIKTKKVRNNTESLGYRYRPSKRASNGHCKVHNVWYDSLYHTVCKYVIVILRCTNFDTERIMHR